MMARRDRTRRKTRMCQGKAAHANKAAALIAVRKMREAEIQSGSVRATRLSAYLCHCGKWHIGHGRGIDWKHIAPFL